MNNKVLVVAAHPDDEVLGCGGTMARHASDGDKVYVMFLSDGEGGRVSCKELEAKIQYRKQCAIDAMEIVGAREPVFAGFADNAMDTLALIDIVRTIEKFVAEVKPDIVYTHHGGDLNIDHQLVHRAVITACRPLPGFSVKEIYTFEVLSSTEWHSPQLSTAFTPVRYVDISTTMDKKMQAINCYKDEIREYPHSRSLEAIEALARLRGANAGLICAEAFGVVRLISSDA